MIQEIVMLVTNHPGVKNIQIEKKDAGSEFDMDITLDVGSQKVTVRANQHQLQLFAYGDTFGTHKDVVRLMRVLDDMTANQLLSL